MTMTTHQIGQLMAAIARLESKVDRALEDHDSRIAALEAEDRRVNAGLTSGQYDIARLQAWIKQHETEVAEAKKQGARSMMLPAGGGGALLIAIIRLIYALATGEIQGIF